MSLCVRLIPGEVLLSSRDYWRFPALLLWMVFFSLGVSPEEIYHYCRMVGHVTTQRALTNSPWILPLGMAAYLAMFTFHRCREAGLDDIQARGKAFQVMILALPAFLPIRLELVLHYRDIPIESYRWVVLGVAAAKTLTWFYLCSVVVRYYLGWGAQVYRDMPSVFPSVWNTEPGAPNGETSHEPPAPQP
jgi:hypothetical protein